MAKRRLLAFISALVLITASPVPAQESGPDAEMSLNEAFETALRKNLQLAVQRVDTELADSAYRLETGNFDSILSSNLNWRSDRAPSAISFISGADTIESDVQTYDISLMRPFHDGSSLTYSFGTVRNYSNSIYRDPNPSYDGGLTLTYTRPLKRGAGKIPTLAMLRVAAIGRDQSFHLLRHTMSQTLLEVEKAYWDLVYALSELKVRVGALAQAQDLVKVNEERMRLGLLAPNEVRVIEAKAGAAARQEAVIIAQDAIADSRERLGRLLGQEGSTVPFFVPTDPPEPLGESDSLQEYLDRAFAHRPDLLQAEADLKAKGLLTAMNRNLLKPKINFRTTTTLAATSGGRTDTLDQVGRLDYPNYFIGFEVEIPLHNRRARETLRQSQLSRKKSEMLHADMRRQIASEVRLSLTQVGTDGRRIEATNLAARLAERKLEAETERYNQGLLTTHDLLIIQEQLAEARSRAVRAKVDYSKSLADLAHATGRYLHYRSILLSEDGASLVDERANPRNPSRL